MMGISKLQHQVTDSARRLDLALVEVSGEANKVKRTARVLPAGLLLGIGVAGGLLLMVMPKHLRGSALLGLGKFALNRLLPLLSELRQ